MVAHGQHLRSRIAGQEILCWQNKPYLSAFQSAQDWFRCKVDAEAQSQGFVRISQGHEGFRRKQNYHSNDEEIRRQKRPWRFMDKSEHDGSRNQTFGEQNQCSR